MWIKLKTLQAGPDGVVQPGTVMDHPDGAHLVATGQAVQVKPPAEQAQTDIQTGTKAAKREKAASKQAKERETRGAETGDAAGE